MTSSVSLGPELEKTIDRLIKDGRYASKSEIIREGIRLVEEREKKLALLDAAIARGLADADAGRTMPLEEAFARLRADLELPEKMPAE
ncbi:MAG: type II toxin-antitoxin system ParD family antitoxin [Beijerinckiaceae bacterium]|jgi:antitoxin ParD1/3/4|nr:type II toxin-antitoxin system ParD family antitoxin [Beijerinckiaceae bacterium]